MNEALRDEAVAYLLDELDAPSRAEFERRLATDLGLRDEVERLAPVARKLAEAPAEVWEAIEPPPLELSGAAPDPVSEPATRRGWREWLVPRRLALAGAGALAIFAGGLVVGSQLGDEEPGTAPVTAQVELRPLADGGAGAATVSLVSDQPGTATVSVEGLPPSEPGTYYELWLLGEDEIVSLGSFRVGPDGSAEATVSIPFDPGLYDSFDISVEREDGDPSHSGDSVLRGPTATS